MADKNGCFVTAFMSDAIVIWQQHSCLEDVVTKLTMDSDELEVTTRSACQDKIKGNKLNHNTMCWQIGS